MTIDQIRDLCDAATPGPWSIGHVDVIEAAEVINSETGFIVARVYPRRDQAFVATARDLMPKLLAVAEAAALYREDILRNVKNPRRWEALGEALAALEGQP